MTDKSDVSEVIQRLVANAQEILGSRLAMELKTAIPDWNAAVYGARSLRDFIVTNVDGVRIAGRSGMDVIYTCSAADPVNSTVANAAPSQDAWRVWVSPNSPLVLAFSSEDATTVLIKRAADVPEGHVRIQPTTVDEHRAIAREYLERVPEWRRAKMKAIADSPHEHWWREWLAELKKLGVLPSWNEFRHEHLRELLKTRLGAAGLDPSAQAAAVGAVVLSRRPRPRQARPLGARKQSEVRSVVAAVMEQMSDEDLRDLKLPVGLVLDVMGRTKS